MASVKCVRCGRWFETRKMSGFIDCPDCGLPNSLPETAHP